MIAPVESFFNMVTFYKMNFFFVVKIQVIFTSTKV